TLIEVTVALVLGAFVLLVARTALGGMADEVKAIMRSKQELDRRMNGQRILQALLTSAYVENTSLGEFNGRSDGIEFGTWVMDSLGRMSQRRVAVARAGQAVRIDGIPGRS